MKAKMKSKVIAVALSLAMAFTMMPMMGAPAYAEDPAPPAPGIALGPDVLSINSNTRGAATVHMAGTKWRVIGYKGDGVASTTKDPEVTGSADTMTLIAADNLKTDVPFRDNNQTEGAHNYGKNTNNEDSNLKTEIEKLTGTGAEKIFSDEEKAGIVPRDLKSAVYTSSPPYTNGIAGDIVENALLWPLSTQESYHTNEALRTTGYSWWLRSQSSQNSLAANVKPNGDTNAATSVNLTNGLRPAFNFNLDSVILTSAAAGGKPSSEGILSEVGTNDLGEWKVTVKDGAHEKFKFKKFFFYVDDKNLMGIKFSGALDATAEKKEYISAIILSKDNKVKYYGKITQAAADKRECIITLDDKMAGGDTLYVFNEQCNKDAVIENGEIKKPAETDYSSELKKVFTAPEVSITTQPQNKKMTYGDTTGNTLKVAAKAEEGCTLSYQWYRKDTENAEPVSLKNETSASYTVPADQNVGTTKYYYCKVRATRADGTWATETSNQAAVTVNKAKLTIKPKDQNFTYNGQLQGPSDIVYAGTEVDEYVAYNKDSLKNNDFLSNITVDGQGKDAGTYELEPSAVNIQDGKGNQVNDNYDITLEKGDLIINKVPVTIKADDKSSKEGEALKELTYKVNGDIVEGEDLGITVSTNANKNKAGTYPIKVAWNNNKNYDAKLVNGKYTVTGEPKPDPPKPDPPTPDPPKPDPPKPEPPKPDPPKPDPPKPEPPKPDPPKPDPPKPDPPAPKVSKQPSVKITAGKKSLTLGWNKIKNAKGYDIFFARCNHSHKKIVCRNVKKIKGNKTFKWTKSGLKKGTAYKFYVRAYITKNGKKTYVSKSPIMHAYTGGYSNKYTNAKSVKVNKKKVTLAQGKTFKIKASVKKLKKNRKLMPKSHAPKLRYMTSNKKIVTVTKSGKVTAKGSGKCSICVYAHNGVSKKVKVTVK